MYIAHNSQDRAPAYKSDWFQHHGRRTICTIFGNQFKPPSPPFNIKIIFYNYVYYLYTMI